MAEFQLLTMSDHPHFGRGDIVMAHNDRRIAQVHAQRVCHWKEAGYVGCGQLLSTSSLPGKYQERTSEYRFERVSKHEVKRVTIASGEEEIFDANPNAAGEYIHVYDFVVQAKQPPLPGRAPFLLFGVLGREIWYGGRTDISASAMQAAWGDIEQHSNHRQINYTRHWPSTRELRRDLFVTVDDFTDAEQADLVSPETKEVPGPGPFPEIEVVKKRRHKVEWDKHPDITQTMKDQILDPDTECDFRDQLNWQRGDVVVLKEAEAMVIE